MGKWLQFELIKELVNADHDVFWEDGYPINLPDKSKKLLDITCRPKNTAKDCYVGIELKIQRWQEYSVRGVIKDLYWPQKIRANYWDFRAIVGVSFFKNIEKPGLRYSKFISELEQMGMAKVLRDISGWTCLIIYWGTDSLSQLAVDNKKSYVKFYKKISELGHKYKIKSFLPEESIV